MLKQLLSFAIASLLFQPLQAGEAQHQALPDASNQIQRDQGDTGPQNVAGSTGPDTEHADPAASLEAVNAEVQENQKQVDELTTRIQMLMRQVESTDAAIDRLEDKEAAPEGTPGSVKNK